jgi:putative redox protein
VATTTTSVTVRSADGWAQDVTARGHSLRADEPKEDGGADGGPRPFELLLGALGACTGMTVRMYAARKKWPLERVDVALTHRRVEGAPAADGSRAPDHDEITRALRFTGPLDDEQRGRLREIADKCPVHRTLSASARIVTTVVA